MIMKKIRFFLFTFLGLASQLHAQTPNDPNESIGILRQNGQIYLVVFVLVTIFAGIILMLIRIERKLNKLESKK
jgi:hypothetical protein